MSVYQEQEEFQGDLHQINDLTVRLDGHVWCEIKEMDEIMDSAGAEWNLQDQWKQYREQYQIQNPSGGDRIPIAITRKVTFSADYDPYGNDITGQLVRAAYHRVLETLNDDLGGGNNYWNYNAGMENWEFGQLLSSRHGPTLQYHSFIPTQYQIYNFDSVVRQVGAGLEEMGAFDPAWM